jgi:hypothetical protein
MSDTRVAVARRTLGSGLAIIGGLLLAVSAFLPWVKIGPGFVVNLPPVSSWDTVSGIDGHEWFLVGDDGFFFLIGGVLIAALGLWTILSQPKAAPIILILSGLAFGLLGRVEYDSIGHSVPCCDMFSVYVGAGVLWIYAGAAATVLAGLVLVRQMRDQHPRLSTLTRSLCAAAS